MRGNSSPAGIALGLCALAIASLALVFVRSASPAIATSQTTPIGVQSTPTPAGVTPSQSTPALPSRNTATTPSQNPSPTPSQSPSGTAPAQGVSAGQSATGTANPSGVGGLPNQPCSPATTPTVATSPSVAPTPLSGASVANSPGNAPLPGGATTVAGVGAIPCPTVIIPTVAQPIFTPTPTPSSTPTPTPTPVLGPTDSDRV
jgi:hypothetical protein